MQGNRKTLSIKKKKTTTLQKPSLRKTLDLLDKDFKTTVLNTLKELKKSKELHEIKKTIYEQNKNINKEKLKKRNQTEILGLKSNIIKLKNYYMGSALALTRQKIHLTNLKIGQLKLLSLKNRKKRD